MMRRSCERARRILRSKDKTAATCPMCHANRRDAVIRGCGHAFCRGCLARWEQVTAAGRTCCPICRAEFGLADVGTLYL